MWMACDGTTCTLTTFNHNFAMFESRKTITGLCSSHGSNNASHSKCFMHFKYHFPKPDAKPTTLPSQKKSLITLNVNFILQVQCNSREGTLWFSTRQISAVFLSVESIKCGGQMVNISPGYLQGPD
jgi:hypothetical protein